MSTRLGLAGLTRLKLVFAARAKTGWLGIGAIYSCGATCLPTDCCFSELAL